MPMFTRDQLYNSMEVARTKSLFAEFGTSSETILTLNMKDKGYPDLHTLYVRFVVDDPSEATFAEEVFGDIAFWERLKRAPFMKKNLAAWKHEADVKRKSKAFKHIMKEIQEDGRNAYQAAKFLIDAPWEPRSRTTKKANDESTAEAAPAEIIDFIKAREK